MKSLLVLALSLASLHSLATEQNVSAYRNLRTDYSVYERRILTQTQDEKFLGTTPLRIARVYSVETLPDPTAWKSMKDLQERFEDIRDERFLTLPGDEDSPRRISWLYPKDGCFTRAALANRLAFRKFIPIPNKVFAFGNLRVKTPYSIRGVVGWWYHVAPIVRVGEKKFVLDPSIEFSRPLELEEWLDRMGDVKRIKVAICGSGTYSPGDSCDKETDGMESRAEQVQKYYLSLEEKELSRLGKESELK